MRLALALVLLAPLASAQPVPLLWQVADADSRIYLLGSIHVLSPSDYPLAPVVEAAYADAEVVAFEVDPGAAEADAMRLLPRFGLDPTGRPLADVLPDTLYSRLDARLRASGLSASAFDGMRPWLVAMAVGELAMAGAAMRPEWGVDRHFYDRAVADGRPTEALETTADQFAALAGVSDDAQIQAVADALATFDDAPAEVERLAALWRSGDADALARWIKTEHAGQPAALKALLATRNRAWIAPIEALLARTGEDVLIVVGAAHLVGPESVPALLAARGHRVVRVLVAPAGE